MDHPVIERPIASATPAHQALRRSLDALAGNRLDVALAEAEAALQAEPESAVASHVLGLAALRLGRLATAIELFERAHQADPQTREHADILAISYAVAGRLVDSLYYGKLATALTPSLVFPDLLPRWTGTFAEHFQAIVDGPLLLRGHALLDAGRPRAAAVLFQQETALDRQSAPAWRGLAEASLAAQRPADAVVAARALCAVETDIAANLAVLGRALTACGDHAEAADCHRRACELDAGPGYRAALVAAFVADPETPRAAVAAAVIAAVPPAPALPRPPARPRVDDRPLRVGFLSARWRGGGGLDLFAPAIEHRDRADWHAFLYNGGNIQDAQGRRLHNAAAAVTDIGAIDDETAALLIGNDGLDLLVDLDLHQPGWRSGIVAARPAPLMVGWLGLPETAAALGYDAMLGDRWTQGEDRRSLLVPGGVFCLPPDGVVAPARRGDHGRLTFTTPALRRQITASVVTIWADLLAAVPQAVLSLDSEMLGGDAAAAELQGLFGERGVGRQIAVDRPHADDSGAMLGDVVLDAPGADGQPEAVLAALRAGVPVVTLPGDIPARRTVASLLGALGLDGMIAGDPRDYVAIAASLAVPATRDAAAAQLARCLDRPLALAPAARAAALGAALRDFVAAGGGEA